VGRLGEELARLRQQIEGASQWEIPPEVSVVAKLHERAAASREDRAIPPYTRGELEELYRQDADDAWGAGVVGAFRSSVGWQSEQSQNTLDEWQAEAKRSLQRIEGGETLAEVYEDGTEFEEDEQ
jgi:predicted nuclease of restriction endonuclease-like RecB superfamily